MKTIQIIFFFILLNIPALFVGGQGLSVTEIQSEKMKPEGFIYKKIFLSDSGNYTAFTQRPFKLVAIFVPKQEKFFLQHIDERMRLKKEVEIVLRKEERRLDYYDYISFGGKYFVLTTFRDKSSESLSLYSAEVDIHKGVIDEHEKIAEIKHIRNQGYTYPRFHISVSQNGKFLVVFGEGSRLKPASSVFEEKNQRLNKVETHKYDFRYWLFDEKLELLRYDTKFSITVDSSLNKLSLEKYIVDDFGSIYILGNNYVTESLTWKQLKTGDRGTPIAIKRSEFVIAKVNIDGSSSQMMTPIGRKYLNIDILIDGKGELNLIGLIGEQCYSNLAAIGLVKTVLSSLTLEQIDEEVILFSEEVLNGVNDWRINEASLIEKRKNKLEQKEEKQNDQSKEYAKIAKQILRGVHEISYSSIDELGQITVVLEERYYTTVRTRSGESTVTSTSYHYDDLVIIKFLKDTVVQNFYVKKAVNPETRLSRSITAEEKDGKLLLTTPKEVVLISSNISNIRDHKPEIFETNWKGLNFRNKSVLYWQAVDERTAVVSRRVKNKVVLYKFTLTD